MPDTPAHRQACAELADWFRSQMLGKLLLPRNLAKLGWRNDAKLDLMPFFLDEFEELAKAVARGDQAAITEELADAANIWSMIQDSKRRSRPDPGLRTATGENRVTGSGEPFR